MMGLLSSPPSRGQTPPPEDEINEEAPGMPEEAGEATEPDEGAEEDEGEQPNVSPEEQAQYEKFMDAALKLIYGPERWPAVLKRLQSAPDKVEALAFVGSAAVLRVATAAQKAGDRISPDVLLHGGAELIEMIAEDAGKFGVHKYDADAVEAALLRGMDMFREAAERSGLVSLEEVDQDLKMLQSADQSGELASVFQALQSKSGGARPPKEV